MFRDRLAVEGVNDQWHDGDDALVHGSDEPSRPAALGASGDHEVVYSYIAAGFGGEELLDGIHRADSALDHGETDEPGVVFGSEVLDAGVGNDVVFRAAFVGGVGEEEGLIWDHPELGDDGVGFGCNAHRTGVGLGGCWVAVLTSADKE